MPKRSLNKCDLLQVRLVVRRGRREHGVRGAPFVLRDGQDVLPASLVDATVGAEGVEGHVDAALSGHGGRRGLEDVQLSPEGGRRLEALPGFVATRLQAGLHAGGKEIGDLWRKLCDV